MATRVELLFDGQARGAVTAAAETRAAVDKTAVAASKGNEKIGESATRAGERVKDLAKVYLGLIGIVAGTEAIKTAVEDWENLYKAHRQLDAQLRANKESIAAVDPWVGKLNKSMEQLGFTNAQTEDAFTKLDRASGSAAVAYRYMGETADLARSRNIDFGTAALLIGKIIQGNTSALNRYGIIIPKGTSAIDALAIVHQKLAGQAQAAVTPMERLRAEVTDLEAEIGGVAVEALRKYVVELADWLAKSENQQKVLHDVETAVHDLDVVIGLIVDSINTLLPLVKDVTDEMGGVKNVVIGLVALKVAIMFSGWGTAAEGAAGEVGLLSKSLAALGPAFAVATAAWVAFNVAKSTFEGSGTGAGSMPVKRHGVWVDPKTGQPVQDQAYWNREAARNIPAGGGVPGSAAAGGVVGSARRFGRASGGVYGRTTLKTLTGGQIGSNRVVDCSAYSYAVYTQNGFKNFPGTSETQWSTKDGPNWTSVRLDYADARPGDLIFATGSPKFAPPGHVGIVIAGAGLSATVMQYYSTGHEADTVTVAEFADGRFGIKRFYLVKADGKAATAGGQGPPGTTELPGQAQAGVTAATTAVKYIQKEAKIIARYVKAHKPKPGKRSRARATYSYTQLRQLWITAGGPENVAGIAAAIAVAESRGESWATNHNSNGTIDFGCWQINSSHRWDPASLLDADQSYNAACAVALYDARGNFGDWTTGPSATGGNDAYLQFMGGHDSPKSSGHAYNNPQTIIDKTSAVNAAVAAQLAAPGKPYRLDRPGYFRGTNIPLHPPPGPVVSGDALLPPQLRAQLRILQARYATEAAQAGVLTGAAAQALDAVMVTNLKAQASTYAQEAVALKARLVSAHGRQKTAIQQELGKVRDWLSGVNDQIVQQLQGIVQADQANVSNVFGTVKQRIDQQFEAATQAMLAKLGGQFFQGTLTPAERALKAFQDARQQQSLQQAVTDAQAQWQTAKTPQEQAAAQQAIQAAQEAITLDRLQAAATAERAKADADYATAERKLTDDRQRQEDELNAGLDKLLTAILNGTAGIDDLTTFAAKYGIVLSTGAIPEMADLADATMALTTAFQDLADMIDVLQGKQPGSHPGGRGNPTDPGTGDSMWTRPDWWRPGFAQGGKVPGAYIGRQDTVLARLTPGETVIDRGLTAALEQAVAGGRLGGGDVHFHITTLATTPEGVRKELERSVFATRPARIVLERRK